MIPAPFDYHKATSVDEAIQLLQQYGDDAKLLAGGHSLIPTMKLRLSTPAHVIDISRLDALKYVRDEGDTIAIGAGATHWMVASSDVVQRGAPLFAEVGNVIGDIQVRNAGTIGGSLAHADPAADWPAAVLASGAVLVARGPSGERRMNAADYFLGLFTTDLGPEEVLTEIRVPKTASGTGSSYQKFAQPASRFAIVGCAAMVAVNNGTCTDVRVAFTGVSGTAFLDQGVADALNGQPADGPSIAHAAEAAAQGVDALSDLHAAADYRKHLARVFARRALTAAVAATR